MQKLPPPKPNNKAIVLMIIFALAVLKLADIGQGIFNSVVDIGIRKAQNQRIQHVKRRVDAQIQDAKNKALERGRMPISKLMFTSLRDYINQ